MVNLFDGNVTSTKIREVLRHVWDQIHLLIDHLFDTQDTFLHIPETEPEDHIPFLLPLSTRSLKTLSQFERRNLIG